MNHTLLNHLQDVVDKYNTESTIDYVSREFRANGLNKSTPNLVFAKPSLLEKLAEPELICITNALYKYTQIEDINPDKNFTGEQMEHFRNMQEEGSTYTPTNITTTRRLDANDNKMLQFLNETYGNYNTKHTYFFIYDTKIKPEENELHKNLGEFTAMEVITMMQGMTGSITTRKNALTLVTKYMEWFWKDDEQNNPMLDVDTRSTPLIIVNNKHISNVYVPLEQLQNDLAYFVEAEGNTITPLDAMIATLIRDGITAEQVARLKYSDFNYEKNTVKVKQDGIRQVKLNEETVNWVKEARDDQTPVGRKKTVLQSIDDHVVKVATDTYTEEQGVKSIRRRLAKFGELGYRPLSENVLIISKKIDMLDQIVERAGVVTKEDFVKVQEYFGNKGSSWFKIRTEYEAVRGHYNIRL